MGVIHNGHIGYQNAISCIKKLYDLGKKIIISGQDYQNADFIFTNHIFEINPRFDDKYSIPEEFEKYMTLKKGNILINEFFKRK